MDVLLTLCEDRLLIWVWTDELLAEWEQVIVREGLRTPESAQSVSDAVRTHFRAPAISQAGVQVMTSDAFLSRLLAHRRLSGGRVVRPRRACEEESAYDGHGVGRHDREGRCTSVR
jgi:hypothetical protein